MQTKQKKTKEGALEKSLPKSHPWWFGLLPGQTTKTRTQNKIRLREEISPAYFLSVSF